VRDAPALSVGQVVRRPVDEVGHPDQVEGVHHAPVELGTLEAEVGGPERHVLADGAEEELVVGILEDDADAAAHLLEVLLVHRQPADHDRAPAGPWSDTEDAVEVQHQGGLAGAVGTEERDPLTAVDVQVDAEQGLVAVGVGEGEPAHVQHGGAHRDSSVWGSLPSYPRESMARWTRSPRS
jgi:hypothetical protein